MNSPSLEDILDAISSASAGNAGARVSIPPEAPGEEMATRMAKAVNLLLDRTESGAALNLNRKSIQDEFERLAAERSEQLRQSEEKFSKAFQASPAAISIASLPEGRWMELNGAHAKLTGYKQEELIGRTSTEFGLVDPVEREKVLRAIREKGVVRDVEIRLRTKSGRYVDVLLSVDTIEINGRKCALTIQYDLTEIKRAEREVRHLNADLERGRALLEEANKDLEAFSYSVAHDLRTPLRSIDGFSKLVLDRYGALLDAAGADYLRRIRDSVRNMSHLIDDLLSLAKVAQSEMGKAPVDLTALARAILGRLRAVEPGREVECDVSEGMAGSGDTRLLTIALENLLGNAWKFTAKRPAARIEFGLAEKDGAPAYFIRDNGAGFDMAYAGKLFGVFQRLHPAAEYEGTGIGLVIVQKVVHRHGGRVWAEGVVGQGAVFYFTLPA